MTDQAHASPPPGFGAASQPDERMQLALDAGAVAGIWFWDVVRDRLTADRRFARSFGLDAAELEAGIALAQAVQAVHPDDQFRVQTLIAQAVAAGGAYRAEYRVRQPNGRYRWIEANGKVMLDSEGRAQSFPGVLVDIEQRKNAELFQAALLALGDQLRGLDDAAAIAALAARLCGQTLNASRTGYSVIDPSAQTVWVTCDWCGDAQTASIAGHYRFADFGSFIENLKRGEVVAIADVGCDPRTAAQLPQFAALGICALLNVPLQSDQCLAGLFLVHQDTPRTWTPDEIDFVRGVADRTWAATATAHAMAQLRSVNASLEREVQQRTADRNVLWRLSKDLMVVARFGGEITAVNPAWEQLLGWTERDLVGTDFMDWVHPDDRERAGEAARAVEAGVVRPAVDVRCLHRDGSARWISWSATSGDGLIVAAGRDVSEARAQAESLRRTEESLRQSQKLEAIGQLTGGVAHDFNNVLAIIKTSIDLLRRPQLTDERRQRFMDSIANAVGRATRLTAQLLAFARRQSLQPVLFDAAHNARAISEMIGSLTGARIEIDLQCSSRPCFIHADPSQFDTALVNLAVNARDAMAGKGRLSMRIEPAQGIPAGRAQLAVEGAFVAVSIGDTGSGIAPEHLDLIFEPFFTTKGVGHGTGLGLSQVFGFARQSGGDIRVHSVVGEGSVFTLYLPRAAPPSGAQPLERQDDAELALGQGACILAVEDNAELAASLAHTLEALGYVPVLATSAERALALLDEHPGRFAAVFSDVVMAGMSGIELGHAIGQRHPHLPVVLTSGYSTVLAQSPAHRFTLLPKPYALDELAQVLHAAIHGEQGVQGVNVRRRRMAALDSAATQDAGGLQGTALAGPVERARLAELDAMRIMDTEEDAAYDELTRLAANYCQTPMALISLLDDKRQWFKARIGLQARETPREYAFCAHAIQHPERTMVVTDASLDARFAANPLVTGGPGIRFYAGAPLVTSTGQALGTLCVIDRVARTLEPRQMEMLQFLAAQVIERLEARRRALGPGA